MAIFHTLLRLGVDLKDLAWELAVLPGPWWLLVLWVVWWLFAVNWKKAWGVLNNGSWLPLGLITVLAALVWSRIAPYPCDCPGVEKLPVFWWQLAATSLLVGLALFCGWLQGILDWGPPEVSFDPPAAADHGHDHHH